VAASSITLVEVVYFGERSRVPKTAYELLTAALADPDCVIEEAVIDCSVVDMLDRVSRAQVPDMPDRIIAATALRRGAPLIARDGKIQASALRTV
jgi:predicted nucleic acid-binding protein